MHVALADDDPEILEQITDCLRSAGHTFDQFTNGQDLIVSLKRETYDIVLLDWNMPQATGMDVMAWAKEALPNPPAFILITARSDKADVVRGLEHGASDFIIKPESSEVIKARIEAAARQRMKPTEERFITYGRYKLDNLRETITIDEEPVKLTAKEFRVAALFFDNLNRPLSRKYILLHVWGDTSDLDSRTLDMHVSRVRSKLALRPENGFAIQTVFGFGYRLDAFNDG